jgi:hypothetical protein
MREDCTNTVRQPSTLARLPQQEHAHYERQQASTARRKYVTPLQNRMLRQNNGFPRAKLARYVRCAALAGGRDGVDGAGRARTLLLLGGLKIASRRFEDLPFTRTATRPAAGRAALGCLAQALCLS